jgi:aspartyl/asparaginyl beta-hydroxylase (cupin superfamily)
LTTTVPIDADALARAAADALARRDGPQARALLRQLTAARPQDADAWYNLAFLNRHFGDTAGCLEALDRSLAVAPDHLPALLLKAEHYASVGDQRVAQAFYRVAVQRAPPMESLPPDLREALRRAERESARLTGEFEVDLRRALDVAGFDPANPAPRVAKAIDLILGRRHLYLQSPTALYFPELPQREFFERAEFPWVGAIEARTAEIREEVVELLRDTASFTPYVRSHPSRPRTVYGDLSDDPAWSAYYLIRAGSVVEEAAARCPRTMAALAQVPLSSAPGRTPSVLFSLLRPGARIPAHHGQFNTRLICHLPLIAPPGCALRVGAETRPWVEGRTLIFDDSMEHEAWNTSDRLRVVLLFDVWRPELGEEERRMVAAMLSAAAYEEA